MVGDSSCQVHLVNGREVHRLNCLQSDVLFGEPLPTRQVPGERFQSPDKAMNAPPTENQGLGCCDQCNLVLAGSAQHTLVRCLRCTEEISEDAEEHPVVGLRGNGIAPRTPHRLKSATAILFRPRHLHRCQHSVVLSTSLWVGEHFVGLLKLLKCRSGVLPRVFVRMELGSPLPIGCPDAFSRFGCGDAKRVIQGLLRHGKDNKSQTARQPALSMSCG